MSAAQKITLKDHASKWRAAMRDGATGPLVIAQQVVAVAENWTVYMKEVGGISCSSWLESVFKPGMGLRYWQRRAEAVRRLGEHARRTWHHEAACWAVGAFSDPLSLKRLNEAVLKVARDRRDNGKGDAPLSKDETSRLAADMFGRKARRRTCSRCKELEAALQAAGVEVP